MKIEYIAIKNKGRNESDKLVNLGYKFKYSNVEEFILFINMGWIFIVIEKSWDNYGYLVDGDYNDFDLELDIDDIPMRKDLDKYVKWLKEGSKLGLL